MKFDIDIHHSPPGAAEIMHARMKGCRLIGYTDDMAEGPDADQIEIPLKPTQNVMVRPDGKEVVLL